MIEWMPRSVGDNGWSYLREARYQGRATLEQVEGTTAVRVPVVVRDWVRAALRRAGQWVMLLARAAFFLAFAVAWTVKAVTQRFGEIWPVLLVAGVILLVSTLSGAYRSVRLRRWPSPGRRADLLVSREGVGVGDLVVPWNQVERVVRFHFASAVPGRTRNFLALQVRDYVGVRGLTPMRAGLANLTRRRLVVLAETTELSHPDELAAALDELVANPVARELLSGAEGPRLLDEGPAWVGRRSP